MDLLYSSYICYNNSHLTEHREPCYFIFHAPKPQPENINTWHPTRAKCHLGGAPVERLLQHKHAQYFHGSAHSRAVQHAGRKQQSHVHLVHPGGSLRRDVAGGDREEVAALLWLLGYLLHLELRWRHTFNICLSGILLSKISCNLLLW